MKHPDGWEIHRDGEARVNDQRIVGDAVRNRNPVSYMTAIAE